MKKRKILLIHPEHTTSYWGFQYSLPLFGKKAMHPPLGLVTVAALLPEEWDLRLVDMNIESLSDEDILWSDMVFTGGMTSQATSLFEVLDWCKDLDRQTVIGGPFGSGQPERLQNRGDYYVLDEAEITFPRFLADLEAGKPQRMYRTEDKPDVTTSPLPRFDLLKFDAYGVMDIQFSRGCPFNCEFCDIIALYGRVPRAKSTDQTLAELQSLYDLGYRGPLFMVDDNFIGNKKAVRELFVKLVPWMKDHDYPFYLITEASLNLAEDGALMDSMREAGFKRVFLGIETPSLEALKETQKLQNMRRDMVDAVHDIIDHGLEVTAGFIVGFDNDTEDIFDRQVEFIKKAQIPWAMSGVLAAPPSTQLWARLEKEGRLLGFHAGDQFGRTNFVTKLDPDVLMHGYLEILERVYEPEAYFDRVLGMLERLDRTGHPNLHKQLADPVKTVLVTLVAVFVQGLKANYRAVWWKFLWRLVTRHRSRYLSGLMNSIVGHHFIRFTRDILDKERNGTGPLMSVHHFDGQASVVTTSP